MPSWKKVIVSGSDATLNSLSVTTSVTAASLTGSLQTDTIQFTAQVIENAVEGQLGYSFDNGKLTFYTENNTPIELGRSIYIRVRNDEVDTLTKGTIVDFTATSTGQTPRVKRALATSGVDCSCFVGAVIQDIPTTQFGYIMLTGVLDGLNLSTFTNGDQVYLSQTVSGSFTTDIPTPPVKAIRIGAVLNASNSPTQGVLFIRPENRTVVFDLANFKETYNTGSFSGSFVGDGSELINLSISNIDTSILVTTSSFNEFTSSYNTGSFTGSFSGDGSALTNLPIPDIDTSTLVTTSSFNDFTSSTDDRLGSLEVESGSIRTDLNTSISTFNSYTSSTDNRVGSLEVESGSIRTEFNSFTSSINSEQTTQNNRLGSLETESGSIRTDLNTSISNFNSYTSSTDDRVVELESYSSSLNSAFSLDGANVTVLGNFQVAGTTTTIDSTTLQIGDNIIELNGTGAVNGGLLIKDVTAPNTISGSLLWNGTTDRWIAGQLDSEYNILLAIGDSVVSGSSQIDLTATTNYISGIKARLNTENVHSGSFLGTSTTTNLTEGTNLYYTDARVKTKLNTDNVHSGSFLGTSTTTNLTEGTNLYYTDARVKTKLNADGVISGSSQVDINSTTGTLNVNKGGTGQTTYTNGQLLIGNTTGNTLTKATLTEGAGITITPGAGSITITNASPNATHTGDVTGATALTIANSVVTNAKLANVAVNTIKGRITTGTGVVEDLTAANVRTIINVADGATANTGTVTSVGGTGTVSGLTLSGTVTTSGNLTLGGTLSVVGSNFGSQTANTFLAAPNGSPGNPTFRAIVAADVPTLNQNTTGTAANVTGTVAVANGGTGQTTFTSGQVLFGSGSSPIGTDSGLFWDNINKRLGIGTSSPNAKLEVFSSGSTVVDIQGSQGQLFSVTDNLIGTVFSVNDISGIPIIEAIADTSNVVNITGELRVTDEVTAFYSDERLKEKVDKIHNPLNIINSLNGFKYINNQTAKNFGFTNNKVQIGLSAQQVQSVLPEIVTLAPFDTIEDENGNTVSKTGKEYLTLDYSKLVPVLVEAIKEQQKQIDELKKIIDKG